VQTLYVYVGRKGIRSQEIPGSRSRRYWKADIDRVKSGGRLIAPPPPGDLRPETNLTLITETEFYYRGRSALDLADNATFEQVAALLWGVKTEDVFTDVAPSAPPLFKHLSELLVDQDDVNRATALFPLLEDANPKAFDLTVAGMARTGADVLRSLAAVIVKSTEPPVEPIHQFLARHLGRGPEDADLLRRVLILSADHGFEPGAVAVRVVSSTGVTPWRSVIAGLAIAFGRRGRLGGLEAIRRLLLEIEESSDPTLPIIRRIRDGEYLPGFDSNVYEHGDPRGRYLVKICSEVLVDDPAFKKLRSALDAALEINQVEPNFALGCMFILSRMGVGSRSAMFHLGRSAGWIAHAIEQYQAGEMLHRTEVYTGPLPD
jgi:citrate synthase